MASNIQRRWRLQSEEIFSWPLRGSGGATPIALTHKRGKWFIYADQSICGDVFVWQYSRGSGGAAPAPADYLPLYPIATMVCNRGMMRG